MRTHNKLWEPPFPFPKGARELPRRGILAAAPALLKEAVKKAPERMPGKAEFFAPHWTGASYGENFFAAGPVLGSPMAVMALEVLVGGGAEEVLFLGFAGSLVPELRPGDYFLPCGALSSEGTSAHYGPGVLEPDKELFSKLRKVFEPLCLFNTGAVWTTDAPLRETEAARDYFTNKGAKAVEMEASALFAAASFRRVKLAAIILITDCFAGEGGWSEGFKDQKFKKALSSIGELAWEPFKT